MGSVEKFTAFVIPVEQGGKCPIPRVRIIESIEPT